MANCARPSSASPPDGARALILTGPAAPSAPDRIWPSASCAPPGAPPPDLGHSIETHYKPLVLALRALPLPVIAAVNGAAAGAGANLALRLRHRPGGALGHIHPGLLQARPGAGLRRQLFPAAPGRHGAGPGPGADWRQAPGRAGRILGPDLEVPRRRPAHAEAEALAARFAQGPPLAYAAIKRTLYASAANTLEQQLDLERDTQRELGRSEDYREGVAGLHGEAPAGLQGKVNFHP
jgi:2-(1,2-epoxy-1,2-dihydrophenyl)acetyl-CoA isomerase